MELASLVEELVELSANSETLILGFFVVDILWLGIDKVLQVVYFVFAMLQFLLGGWIRGELVVNLVLLLGHVDFVVWGGESLAQFVLDLG